MNIHHKSHAKLIVAMVLVVLVAAGGAFVYFKYFAPSQNKTEKSQTTDVKTPAKSDDSNSAANNSDTDNTNSNNNNNPQTPPQLENPVDQNATTLNITVNSAQVVDTNAQILVTIDQLLGSGTCTLMIGDYQTTANVIANPQSSSCEGFSVPLSAIGNSRDFTLQVVSGDKSGSVSGVIK
jgi:hypothetical protein